MVIFFRERIQFTGKLHPHTKILLTQEKAKGESIFFYDTNLI